MRVKFIFLDFGGCIDAPGIHTRTLFWDAFRAELGLAAEERTRFQEAYSLADKRMMDSGEAKALGLREFNRHNARLIAKECGYPISDSEKAADRVTRLMDSYLVESREALIELKSLAPLALISNFTGNLPVILEEFSLSELFESVTESFYAGAAKPDLKIFRQALSTTSFAPEDCLYIGDNPVNDIAPAKALGMKAVLIHPPGQRRECGADAYVETLRELARWVQSA
ncbi:MAG: HAD family hydrolase [Proteobacteria bacterium]|nr:MAG: HAD family hydrolase [Pseudomonadota bacterium]